MRKMRSLNSLSSNKRISDSMKAFPKDVVFPMTNQVGEETT